MNDKLTLAAFAEWCESRPKKKAYDFNSLGNCACAQYSTAERLSWGYVSHPFWGKANVIASHRPWTFGALAARLRASIGSA